MEAFLSTFILVITWCFPVSKSFCIDTLVKAKTGTSVQLHFGVSCLLPIRLYRRSSNSRHLKLITRFGDIDFTDEKRHTISMLESGQNKSIVVNIQTLSDEDGGFYILQCYQPPTLSIIRLSIEEAFNSRLEVPLYFARRSEKLQIPLYVPAFDHGYFFKSMNLTSKFEFSNESLNKPECPYNCKTVDYMTNLDEGCYVFFGENVIPPFVIYVLQLYNFILTIQNNSVFCVDEYHAKNYVIVLEHIQDGRMIRQLKVRGYDIINFRIPQVTSNSNEFFRCTSYLDTNRTAVSTRKTVVYKYTDTPVFAPSNKNVFKGELAENVTISILVYSKTMINIVRVEEIKNDSLHAIDMYDLSISTVSLEDFPKNMQLHGYRISFILSATPRMERKMNLWVNNSVEVNVHTFYVETKGCPRFALENKNVFRGKLENVIDVRICVHSITDIEAAWVDKLKNGSAYKAQVYGLDTRKAACEFADNIITFTYEISFKVPVTSLEEQLLNLWVRNRFGKTVFRFYTEVDDVKLNEKEKIQSCSTDRRYFIISVVINGLLVVCVLFMTVLYCHHLKQNRTLSSETNERRVTYAYNEIGTLDYRFIDVPPQIPVRQTPWRRNTDMVHEYHDIDDFTATQTEISLQMDSHSATGQTRDYISLSDSILSVNRTGFSTESEGSNLQLQSTNSIVSVVHTIDDYCKEDTRTENDITFLPNEERIDKICSRFVGPNENAVSSGSTEGLQGLSERNKLNEKLAEKTNDNSETIIDNLVSEINIDANSELDYVSSDESVLSDGIPLTSDGSNNLYNAIPPDRSSDHVYETCGTSNNNEANDDKTSSNQYLNLQIW